jgi:predicted enzyme related to lactoylglutathione lyase
MPVRYAHTNIIAKDWKSLSDFYCKVFECQFVPPKREQSGKWLEEGTGVAGASLEGVHLRLPGHGENGPTLEIYTYKTYVANTKLVANKLGFGHIAFSVDSVTETISLVINNGGKMLGKTVTKEVPEVGILTFTYMTDPEGNIIEIQSWE